PGVIATTNGGTVTMNADGSFTYLSAAGYTGVDSFDYTVTDGDLSDVGPVTMNVPVRVWYADNSGTPPGDGRDTSPFTTLKAAEAAAAAGETIYLRAGDGTTTGYDEGIVLANGVSLIGQGVPADVTVTLNSATVTLLAAGTAPQVTRGDAGTTVQLALDNTVRGFDVASTAGAGIAGNGFGTLTASSMSVAATGGAAADLETGTVDAVFASLSSSTSAGAGLRLVSLAGTLTAAAGAITGATNAGVDIVGGDADVAYGGTVTSAAARPVSITARTGGTVTLSGLLTSTGAGILVQGNTGGSVTFSGGATLSTAASHAVELDANTGSSIAFTNGGLAITTTTGTGFRATGGGTVSATGAGNTVASTGGTAVEVTNTTIGAAGLGFASVSATGGANGIVLDNTGALGGLSVTGSGGACNRSVPTCTGGTIGGQAGADGTSAGNGVWLNATSNVTLTAMRFTGAANFAIRGVDVSGFTADNVLVDGAFGTSVAHEEAAVAFDGLTGSALIRDSYIGGGITDNVRVRNTGGTLDRLTLDADTIGLNNATTGRHGLSLAASAGVFNVTVDGSHLLGSRTDRAVLRATGTASADLVFSDNVMTNTQPVTVSGSAGLAVSAGGSIGDNVSVTYAITSNTMTGARGVAIAVTKGLGIALLDGEISGNTIGDAFVANSGSTHGSGIFVSHATKGTHRVRIDGNSVHQFSGAGGIHVQAGGIPAAADPGVTHDGTMHATIVNNVVSNPGTNNPGSFVDAMFFDIGTNSGDQYTVCLNVGQGGSNNIANGGRPDEGGGAFTLLSNAPGATPILKMAGYPLVTDVGNAAEANIYSTFHALNVTGGTGYVETPSITATYAGNAGTGTVCNLP
ncbi:MAG TPA: Ig-like domain-containing protein, partial [Longimicrobiales bacterium]|nr:Ig-like domain-containing protein [Longimicrobiales bacterium]